jgi:D-glycero-D-manno-heptose 1,7-bisphosphate phosphatase
VEKHHLSDPEQVELVPGSIRALERLAAAGYLLVVVTNQSGIARGLFGEEEYRAVTARMEERLAAAGVSLDAVKRCPHHPDHTGPCACRKPATGLHLEAAGELGIDLAASWYVGDKISDVRPALELGGRGILVLTGHGAEERAAVPDGIPVADDLPAAVTRILGPG